MTRIKAKINPNEFDWNNVIEFSMEIKWEYDLLKEVRAEKITKEQFRRKLKRLQKQHGKMEFTKK